MTSKTLTLAALLAPVVLSGCSPRAPAETSPRLVTLATFEGEIDPDAGTFVVRTPSAPVGNQALGTALVVPEGSTGVTIASASVQRVTDGCSTGVDALEASVTITLGASNPGFAGGLFAEIQTITGTGGEGCNSGSAPSGLDATKGLWSYGTVRSGATTSVQTWRMRIVSGQKTTFTGHIVGVAGVTFAWTGNRVRANSIYLHNPIIAYTRGKVAYAAGATASIVYVNLDGTWASTVTDSAGETVRSLSFQQGTTANEDVLWYSTTNRIGVVFQGTAYSVADTTTNVAQVAADPTTMNRAWIINARGHYGKPVTFDVNAKTFSFPTGGSFDTVDQPASITFGAGASPLIYVASNTSLLTDGGLPAGANWLKAWTMAGGAQVIPSVATANCDVPYSVVLGPDGKIWFPYNKFGVSSGFCSYEHGAGTPYTQVAMGSSGGIGVGRSVTGAGNSIWGNLFFGRSSSPVVNQVAEVVVGQSDYFKVDFPDLGIQAPSWGEYPQSNPGIAGSPAVSVSGTDFPAYIWLTTGNGLLRIQPQ